MGYRVILFACQHKYNIDMEKFFYRVSSGETIFSVAQKLKIPPAVLIKQNNLKTELQAGDLLFVEKVDAIFYQVKPFETIEEISKKFSLPANKILDDNGLSYVFYGISLLILNNQ